MSQKHIDKYAKGDLITRLKNQANDYLGPGGQGADIQQANHHKRQNLLEAIEIIKSYFNLVEKL